MSCKDYSDIAVLIEEAPNEINNMLYKELVFPVFKTSKHWRFDKRRVLVLWTYWLLLVLRLANCMPYLLQRHQWEDAYINNTS